MSWHTYLNLEKDFIDITRYVALDRNNSGVWSEKIAQLVLLTGSAVDSVFNEMRKSSLLPQIKPIVELLQNPEPHIGNYREVYEPIYKLSGVELIASHGLTNYGKIIPFQPFAIKKNPAWWDAYNEIKHGFFQNMRKGTLDYLVHALGALFTLNVLHKDSQQYLATIGVIDMGVFDRMLSYRFGGSEKWGFLKNSYVGLRGDKSMDAWATSEVFCHLFRKE